jgi:hypothetical protein
MTYLNCRFKIFGSQPGSIVCIERKDAVEIFPTATTGWLSQMAEIRPEIKLGGSRWECWIECRTPTLVYKSDMCDR